MNGDLANLQRQMRWETDEEHGYPALVRRRAEAKAAAEAKGQGIVPQDVPHRVPEWYERKDGVVAEDHSTVSTLDLFGYETRPKNGTIEGKVADGFDELGRPYADAVPTPEPTPEMVLRREAEDAAMNKTRAKIAGIRDRLAEIYQEKAS